MEVGSVWAAGPGIVQWYTHQGGGRARSPNAAFEAVKAKLGVTR